MDEQIQEIKPKYLFNVTWDEQRRRGINFEALLRKCPDRRIGDISEGLFSTQTFTNGTDTVGALVVPADWEQYVPWALLMFKTEEEMTDLGWTKVTNNN